jgi:hypothetical protein
MGAGWQHWWRDCEAECRAWDGVVVERRVRGGTELLYRNGARTIMFDDGGMVSFGPTITLDVSNGVMYIWPTVGRTKRA